MKFPKLLNSLITTSLLATSLLQIGCSEDQLEEQGEGITVSGTLATGNSQQKLSLAKVSSQSIVDYQVHCVTFTDNPYSTSSVINPSGRFSLRMPVGVPFGCFIVLAETQAPVATIALAGTGASSSSSTALQFRGNAELGELNLDLTRRQVVVPREAVESVLAPVTASSINLQDMANRTYSMNCMPSGNAYIDQACQQDIESDNSNGNVFFRIMSATRAGEAINGIGVWESEQAFNDCGGIDLTDSAVSDLLADEGIQFTQGGVSQGPSFNAGSSCPLRDPNQSADHDNLDRYYASGELIPDGNGYTLYAHDSHLANPGCLIENTTVVHFSGASAQRMIGQFMTNENYIDLNNGQGDCSHLSERPVLNYMVEFTQQ